MRLRQRQMIFPAIILLLAALICGAMAEPSSTGDGLMPKDDLLRLIRWVEMGYAQDQLYEDVAAFTGVEGLDEGNKGANSMTTLGDHIFRWVSQENDKHYIRLTFRGKEESGRFEYCQWSVNGLSSADWQNADLSEWLIANACRETQTVSNDIQRFSNPAVTVTAQLPVRGWDTSVFGNELTISKTLQSKPKLVVTTYDKPESFDFYLAKYENVQEISGRIIAGVEMKGRSYRFSGHEWLEYTAQLGEKVYIGVQITCDLMDLTPGTEASAVLNSLAFAYTDGDGNMHSFEPVPEATATPAPEPTPIPTPVPTPEPTVTPEPTPEQPADAERFAAYPDSIPEHWHILELTNERTGVSMSVYLPLDGGDKARMKIHDPGYNKRDSVSYSVVYYHNWDPYFYNISYLILTASEEDVEKMLAGNDLTDKDGYSHERIRNSAGMLMEKVVDQSGR